MSIQRLAHPTGVKEGLWVESEASVWMGGVSGSGRRKAESAGEMVTKEGGVRRRVGDEGRRSQKTRNAEQEKTTMTTTEKTTVLL